MKERWAKVNQIRLKGQWTQDDIDTLVCFIGQLIHANNTQRDDLKHAIDNLVTAQERIKWYRRQTIVSLK